MSAPVGTIDIACPECHTPVTVPVHAEIVDNDHAHEGEAQLVCTPDTADLWAHMWTHAEP